MAFGIAPKFEREYPLGEFTAEQFVALGIKAALALEWKVGTITSAGFLAYTDISLSSYKEEVRIHVKGDTVFLRSQCIGEQVMDWGKNKSNVNDFLLKVEESQKDFTTEELDAYIETIRHEMEPDSEEPQTAASRSALDTMGGVWGLFVPKKGYLVTPILIDLNILVFILMAISGVSIMEPTVESLLKWGASYRPMTLAGQPWRLMSSVFIHIGIMHLLMNMYALLYIGVLLESILGAKRFIAAYLLSGLVASLTSLGMHENTVGAGASGAIFGMYGVFLAFLTTNLIEKQARKAMMTSILFFVGFNLLNGLKGGIDNAAHIGGLISGMLIGYAFVPSMKNTGNPILSKFTTSIITVVILSISTWFYFSLPNDYDLVQKKLNEFEKYEKEAMMLFKMGDSAAPDKVITFIKTEGIPDWVNCKRAILELNKLNISDEQKKRNRKLLLYCDLRLESYEYIQKAYAENTDAYGQTIDSLNRELQSVLNNLNAGNPGK